MQTHPRRTPTRAALAATTAVLAALTLSACGSAQSSGSAAANGSSGTAASGGGSGAGASGGSPVTVVASTDVWGDVVHQIAGNLSASTVQITSIITNPTADPHSYQANTQDLLALSKADLVVENGGGYDDFVGSMMNSAHNSGATVLNAVAISGKQPDAAGDLNEHVWYDLPTVARVGARIEQALAVADPADAATYRKNLAAFDAKLAAMRRTESQIKAADGGDAVAITEPVPLYMLDACGLVDRTPTAFSEAIDNGTDVSPALLHQAVQVISQRQVRLLAYNEQTTGAETEAVLNAAKQAGVAIVPVTETLPAGQSYLTWMQSNLSAIRQALR